VLKAGLERTLSQARHLVGTIEKDADGRHSFVKRRNSTVKLVVQYLDAPEDNFPSFADIEAAHFVGTALGDINLLSNAPMTYGEKPEADPDSSPAVSSYKANFIPGGLIFNMHSYHYANDVTGWANFTQQLAANCHAILTNTAYPTWHPASLDRSRFTAPTVPAHSRVAAPPQAPRHPSHRPSTALLFHIPKSRAAALKALASPTTDDASWISTYDAVAALTWRVLTRLRRPLYNPDPTSTPLLAEGVNLTKRLPPTPFLARMQGNLFLGVVPELTSVPPLPLSTILSAPLSELASHIRQITSAVIPELLAKILSALAPVSDKKALSVRVNSFPPLSMAVTDWRDARGVCGSADFGWGRPRAFRHLFDTVTEGLVIVYPPRDGDTAGGDEGVELQVAVEKELKGALLEDEEWGRWVQFRGVDC
jgi:hypothetical protein